MIEKFNCPGLSDCSIDTHLILVRYADYRTLALASESLLKYLDEHDWAHVKEGDIKVADDLRNIVTQWRSDNG